MKDNINDITKEDFREALETAFYGTVTLIAPLGCATDDIYLYNKPTPREFPKEGFIAWSCCIKIKVWSNIPTLLIGNKSGSWLSELKISKHMGFEYILNEFYRQFVNVKDLIEQFTDEETKIVFDENAKETNWREVSKVLEFM